MILERASLVMRMLRGLLGSGRRVHAGHFERVLGTSLELHCVTSRRAAAAEGERVALAEIARLERIFSIFDPASELSRWQETLDRDVVVSPELAEVLELSEEWRAMTGGAFDPAVEEQSRMLRTRADEGLPEPTWPPEARTTSPLWRVERGSGGSAPTARKLIAGALSLNGIAKGYIIDRACEAVAGVEGMIEVLVNLGGDIRHIGSDPASIGVTDPFADAENLPPLQVVRIRNQGLATSGGYRRGFRSGGRWLSHLIDPRSGRPAAGVRSATVVAPSAAAADALATAFAVLPAPESVAIADTLPGSGCLLILEDRTTLASTGWKQYAVR